MVLPGLTVRGVSPKTKAKNYSTSFDGTYGLTPRDIYGMMPVVGDALDIKDIGTDLYNGDYINAGIGAGLLLLPNMVEKPFKFAKSLYKKRNIISKVNKELEKGIKENSVLESYNKVPTNKDILTTLPGIGRKTANVFLSEFYGYPAIAVDTHVERVSKRLKMAYLKDDVYKVEKKLERKFPKEEWSKRHLQLVLFGRYHCKAIKPNCSNCKLKDICRDYK